MCVRRGGRRKGPWCSGGLVAGLGVRVFGLGGLVAGLGWSAVWRRLSFGSEAQSLAFAGG